MRLIFLIVLPILSGLIAYILPNVRGKISTIGIQLVSLGAAVYNFKRVSDEGVYSFVVGNYHRQAGITLTSDLLSSAMILLTVFIFLMCMIYAKNNTKLESHFYFLFLVLQSCMIALFITRDLFNIFVIIEVCTIIIAMLIMYKNEKSLYNSLIYLMNNSVAMIFFVFGIAILYKNLHSLNLDVLAVRIGETQLNGSYIAAYAMLLTGISFKCALMPMFSWLPRAHAAKGVPTVVSAVLSGLYIKTGVFVFIRLREVFLPLIDIDGYLLIITMITSILGVVMAMKQNNIKLIMAYSTISQVGLIMSGILLGNRVSYSGAVYHLINHVIFKSTLFLCAGIYIKHYGHKDIRRMRGAFKSLPLVSTSCLFAVLGVTGAPFFNGSISKYFIQYGAKGSPVEYLIVLINIGTIIYFLKFLRILPGPSSLSSEVSCRFKTLTVSILGIICLLGGLLAQGLMKTLLAFEDLIDPQTYLHKGIIYLVTLFFCWLFSRKDTLKLRVSEKRRYSPSFNGISLMTCTFFMVTSIAMYLTNRI